MRINRKILILIGICLGSVAVWQLAVIAIGENASPIRFERPPQSIGTVFIHGTRDFSMTVYNSSNSRPVHITNVVPSCGCTTVARRNFTIAPGGLAHVLGSYTNRGKVGNDSIDLMFRVSGYQTPIHGRVIADDATQLPDLVDIGTFTSASQQADHVVFRYRDGQPRLAITDIEFDRTRLSVTGSYRGDDYLINIKPTLSVIGSFESKLLVHSNDAIQPLHILRVIGYVPPRIVVDPSTVSLGSLRSGTVVSKAISLTSPYNEPFRITKALCSDRSVLFNYDAKSISPSHLLSFRYTCDGKRSQVDIPVFIYTDENSRPIEVHLYGFIPRSTA